MASAMSIVWAKLVHDLGIYEHEVTIEEVTHHHQFEDGTETPEEAEVRLHTDIAGASDGPQL